MLTEYINKQLQKQLQNQYEKDEAGHTRFKRIFHPYYVLEGSYEEEYVKHICALIKRYASKGKVSEDTAPWIWEYISTGKNLRLIYRSNDRGGDTYIIQPLNGKEYWNYFEYEDSTGCINQYMAGDWEQYFAIGVNQKGDEK